MDFFKIRITQREKQDYQVLIRRVRDRIKTDRERVKIDREREGVREIYIERERFYRDNWGFYRNFRSTRNPKYDFLTLGIIAGEFLFQKENGGGAVDEEHKVEREENRRRGCQAVEPSSGCWIKAEQMRCHGLLLRTLKKRYI